MHRIFKISDSAEAKINIVFVHGLGGDHSGTWVQGNFRWPDAIASDLPNANVYSIAYGASPSSWLGRSMPLEDTASNVLELLMMEDGILNLPIVFVCHSLGGIIVKQMFRTANDQQEGRKEAEQLIDMIGTVAFLSTPHTGSDHAVYLERLGALFRAGNLTKALTKNNSSLRALNTWYRNWRRSESFENLVFFETIPPKAGMIVEADAADPGLKDVYPIPMSDDHVSISKPFDVSGLQYKKVLKAAKRLLNVYDENRSDKENSTVAQTDAELLGELHQLIKTGHLNRVGMDEAMKYLVDVKLLGEQESKRYIDLWIARGNLNKVSANRLEVPEFGKLR